MIRVAFMSSASSSGKTVAWLHNQMIAGRLTDYKIVGVFNPSGVVKAMNMQAVPFPIYTETDWEEVEEKLTRIAPDLIILSGLIRLVPADLCDKFTFVNLHPGDPNVFPGLDPQKQAFEAGVRQVCNTIHHVTRELDKGPIIAQQQMTISDACATSAEGYATYMHNCSFALWETVLYYKEWRVTK